MEWIAEHQPLLIALVIALWGAVKIVVKLTPSKKDDEVLAKIEPIGLMLQKIDWDKVATVFASLPTKPDFSAKRPGDDEDEAKEPAEPPDM